jgi:GNAT superfamily N-acetyltransferase
MLGPKLRVAALVQKRVANQLQSVNPLAGCIISVPHADKKSRVSSLRGSSFWSIMDYPSNLPAFSKKGFLGLLQGLDKFQLLPTDELRGVRQGLLSNDLRGTATNLGLLGLGTVGAPVVKLAKAAQAGYKALRKGDHIKVPYLDNPSKQLVQHEVGFGVHQIAPEDGRFNLVGPTKVIKSGKGDAKVGYQVLDGVEGKKIGEVDLLRRGRSGGKRGAVGTTADIDAIVNIEIAPKHRKKGIATDILESLRASTDGKPLGINDIQNIKFFTKYRDAVGQVGKTKKL